MVKNYFLNINYFIKEAKTIFKVDLLSNMFSILSISFIFLILSMITSGWWITSNVVKILEGEAEINVFYLEEMAKEDILKLARDIEEIKGVRNARIVSEEESFNRMENILGKESKVLSFFDDNPFSSFIEVKIHIEEMDGVIDILNSNKDIESIRDNRQVLDRLRDIVKILKFLGILFITAVGVSTIIIISHIIRQGIYNNRDMINTLKLLGAPDGFIGLPFLLEGLLLTLLGGIVSVGLALPVINFIYSQTSGVLPFVPLISRKIIIRDLSLLILGLSFILGIVGSIFGLTSSRSD